MVLARSADVTSVTPQNTTAGLFDIVRSRFVCDNILDDGRLPRACPTTLVLTTLNWQTLQRRRIIKQAMTFYKILNNIIKISPPSGLLTRSHNRHHYIVPRSRLNTVVYSFYPRAIRIWNTIPKEITEITKPESFQAAISKLPFTTPVHLKCL